MHISKLKHNKRFTLLQGQNFTNWRDTFLRYSKLLLAYAVLVNVWVKDLLTTHRKWDSHLVKLNLTSGWERRVICTSTLAHKLTTFLLQHKIRKKSLMSYLPDTILGWRKQDQLPSTSYVISIVMMMAFSACNLVNALRRWSKCTNDYSGPGQAGNSSHL